MANSYVLSDDSDDAHVTRKGSDTMESTLRKAISRGVREGFMIMTTPNPAKYLQEQTVELKKLVSVTTSWEQTGSLLKTSMKEA